MLFCVTDKQTHMSSDEAWETAWQWLCRQRKTAPDNSDVWHLRFWKARDDPALKQQVESGHYRLSPLQVVRKRDGSDIAIWGAQDALVLKWTALRIAPYLPVHARCHHVKGAGVRHSLRTVIQARSDPDRDWQYVYRTDIKGYYQHIRKGQLTALIAQHVPEPVLRDLAEQFIDYTLENGGEFHTPQTGISRGCALSPLFGATLLYHVDVHFAKSTEVFYVRYMDDFLLLAPTRWKLRKAIQQLNTFLETGGFTVHPDKTQIGRLEKGFDWLGVWFDAKGMRPSPRAVRNHRERCLRLYEQSRRRGLSEEQARARVQMYVRRWVSLLNSENLDVS